MSRQLGFLVTCLLLVIQASESLNLSRLPVKQTKKALSRRRSSNDSNEAPNGTKILSVPSSDVIAAAFNVRPGSHAPRIIWKYSWRIHGRILPLLHAFDRARSKDMDYSLKCLWCKAITGQDRTSPVFDGGLAYDMLPSGSRWIVKLPNRIFPRLIHFNIELRTAYLDRALRQEIIEANPEKKIRLITLGAGYDARSVRFLTEGLVEEAWEIDVKPVVTSKQIMLDRLQRRRPDSKLPNLVTQDLNDVESFQRIFSDIVDPSENGDWHNIIMLEGVLIYLDEGVPSKLLSFCSSYLKREELSGSLVFADLFRGLPSSEINDARDRFGSDGWELLESSWCVKPGLARHMGVARVPKAVR
jgi:O-methyltransferase involved in polyketide biosynthesis